MEYKVRQESHTLLEKLFQAHSKEGLLKSTLIPNILREFNPEISYEEEDLQKRIGEYDLKGTGGLDYDSYSSVVLHYLLKQTKKESNEFGHKQNIGLADFSIP